MKNVRFVGLDVHAETIAVAVAEVGGEVRTLGVIPNRADSVGRLIRKLGKPEQLRVCYEAGPTGYAVLAVERVGREMRGGSPDAGAGEGG
jgi:transposase